MDDNEMKLNGAEKPVLNTCSNGGIKQPEGTTKTPDNGKEQKPQEPPKDFKVAEIWIRDGRVFMDAQAEFWKDKCRALGLLEYCKDIIKEARNSPEPTIIPAKGNMMDFARKFRNKFRRK